MRKCFALVLLVFVSLSVSAQRKKKDQPVTPAKEQPAAPATTPASTTPKKDSVAPINPLLAHYVMKYQLALRWSDSELAKDVLYDLIVENQGNDSTLLDLAIYYYQKQQFASAVLVSKDFLKKYPKNITALQIAANASESIAAYDQAAQYYESLYLLDNNTSVLYKMAVLQWQLKRYKEAITSLDILLTAKDIDTIKVSYPTPDGKQKEFSMKVAVYNLRGAVAQEEGDKVAAKKYYEQALAIAPDFPPAKDALTRLK